MQGKLLFFIMSIRVLSLTLFLLAIVLFSYYKKSELTDYLVVGSKKELLEKLPNRLIFEDLDLGKTLTPNDYFKKDTDILFLHFWATWCGPCEKEFPEFEQMIKELNKLENPPKISFVFVAINDKTKELKRFIKRFKGLEGHVTFLRDQNQRYKKHLGVTKIPETWVFKKNGQVAKRYLGPQNWERKAFVNFLTSDHVKVYNEVK